MGEKNQQGGGPRSPVTIDKDKNPSKTEKKGIVPNPNQEKRGRQK